MREIDWSGARSQKVFVDVVTWSALVVWALAAFNKVFTAVGYQSEGLSAEYLRSKRHLLETVGVLLTGSVIFWTLEEPALDNAWYRGMLGLSAFLTWVRFLVSLGQFRGVGVRILPLLSTIWDLGPLLAVVAVYLAGSANLLYCLNVPVLSDAVLFTYRLAVTRDVDLEAKVEEGEVEEAFEAFVVPFVVFVKLGLGIFLMNLFTAVLCARYSAALHLAPLTFMQLRARRVLDRLAQYRGRRVLFCRQRRRQEQRRHLRRADMLPLSTPAREEPGDDRPEASNLWFTLLEQR